MEFEKTKTLQAEKMKCYDELLDYLNNQINNSLIEDKNILELVNKINNFFRIADQDRREHLQVVCPACLR